MQGKAARACKDNREKIRDCTVEVAALESRIPLHRTFEWDELDLDPLLCKVPALCGDDERDGIRIRHQTDGDLRKLCILWLRLRSTACREEEQSRKCSSK